MSKTKHSQFSTGEPTRIGAVNEAALDDNYDPEVEEAEAAAQAAANAPPGLGTDASVAAALTMLTQVSQQIADSLSLQAKSNPIRKVPYNEIKFTSPFNPTGNRKRALNRRVFVNGLMQQPHLLTDQEIAFINAEGGLRQGVFVEGKVVVRETITPDGVEVNIDYANARPEQRMDNKSHWRTFAELLQRLTTEEPMTPQEAMARRRSV